MSDPRATAAAEFARLRPRHDALSAWLLRGGAPADVARWTGELAALNDRLRDLAAIGLGLTRAELDAAPFARANPPRIAAAYAPHLELSEAATRAMFPKRP